MKRVLAFSMLVMTPLSLVLCLMILPGFIALMLIPAGASLIALFALLAVFAGLGMLFTQYGQNGGLGIGL